MFDFDMTDDTYSDTGTRPKTFNVHAERNLTQIYNTQHSTSVKKVDYLGEDLARCHIASFDDIRRWLVDFMNDPDNEFPNLIRNVTELLNEIGAKSKERKNAEKALDQFTGSVTGKESSDSIIEKADKLLRLLNSASANLRPGNSYVNSFMGQNFDPHATLTSSGQYSFTTHTKSMFGLGDQVSDVMRTPTHQSRVITSNGVYARGDLTPTTGKMAFDHGYQTRNIKSDKVHGLVYGSNSKNF